MFGFQRQNKLCNQHSLDNKGKMRIDIVEMI